MHCLLQGEKFLDSLDDLALQTMVFIDGMDVWGPTKAVGLTDFKLWMAGWLQQYEVSAAVTGTAATAYSNKVGATWARRFIECNHSLSCTHMC